jgi:hypothetical protein
VSDEKYRIKGWQTQALRAAVALMEAKAKISESVEALERLGLDADSYDFQPRLNAGKAYRCATDGCEAICFAPMYADDKEPLRCEPHEKLHEQGELVKLDAKLERGEVVEPAPAKPVADIPF